MFEREASDRLPECLFIFFMISGGNTTGGLSKWSLPCQSSNWLYGHLRTVGPFGRLLAIWPAAGSIGYALSSVNPELQRHHSQMLTAWGGKTISTRRGQRVNSPRPWRLRGALSMDVWTAGHQILSAILFLAALRALNRYTPWAPFCSDYSVTTPITAASYRRRWASMA